MNGSIQFSHGKYIYESASSAYYFTAGIQYRTDRWNISVSLPVVGKNSNLIINSGGMFLTKGKDGKHQMSQSPHGQHGQQSQMESVATDYKFALGDIYLFGEYLLFSERRSIPSFSISPLIKLPAASTENNFGTGEYDYGASLNLRKMFSSYIIFADVGYLVLGEPADITYKNSITSGAGLGRFFGTGKTSGMIYFKTYSKILDGTDPPRQASASFFYRVNSRLLLSAITSIGLSESSPDFMFGISFSHIL